MVTVPHTFAPSPDVASTDNAGRLFQRIRWQMLANTLHSVFRQSLVRVISVVLCNVVVWAFVFAISYVGFGELFGRLSLSPSFISPLFDLMFLVVTGLLMFSTGIILYSSLYSSAETSFLLCLPVRSDQIFAYKFQGAVGFSCWAFVLLGSPILIAFGLQVPDGGAPWSYYASLPLFFIGYLLLPGSIGALVTLVLVYVVPRHHRTFLIVTVALLVIGLGWWSYRMSRLRVLMGPSEALSQFLQQISLLRAAWMPTHWISQGIFAASRGEHQNVVYYLALIWSNGLVLYLLTAWAARYLYRDGYNFLATGGSLSGRRPARRRIPLPSTDQAGDRQADRFGLTFVHASLVDRLLAGILFFLDHQTRLLIVKDFRTFRRDPKQWLQVVILLGLAAFLFGNLRHFYQQDIGQSYRNAVSLLNLMATAFFLCAFTGRFVFPMLSLEGKKFWILGLLPLERTKLLAGKFAFSATGCLIVAEFWIVFSNFMLSMPFGMMLVHTLTIAVLAFGLSGLSVGLGACMANFRETDPSKIAVGFGGTLNLVTGLLFLVVVILLLAGPWHLVIAFQEAPGSFLALARWWLWLCQIAGLIIGGIAIFVPMRAGAWALRQMEF